MLIIYPPRCFIAMSLSGSGVQLVSDIVTVGLGDISHTHSLGKILADQAV
jgi:hypothetical protein